MSTASHTPRWHGATSRRGGLPVTWSPARAEPPDQLGLGFDSPVAPRARREVLPDVVHVPDWLDAVTQGELVRQFRTWATPPAGLRHPRMPTGHLMSVQSVCLGWHWQPYAYTKTADDTDGAPVKPLPPSVATLARAAVADAYGANSRDAREYAPDAAIVNLYPEAARLGLHKDWEEPSDAPVVTISIGDACIFRLAAVDRRTAPFIDVELRSGDLLVFGRANRRIFHGVPRVLSGTAPPDLAMGRSRLSITVRQTGLA